MKLPSILKVVFLNFIHTQFLRVFDIFEDISEVENGIYDKTSRLHVIENLTVALKIDYILHFVGISSLQLTERGTLS